MLFTAGENVFKTECVFYVNEPLSRVKKIIVKQGDPEDIKDIDWKRHEMDSGVCFTIKLKKEGLLAFLIWMPKFTWTVPQMSTLSHEIVHLTFAVLDLKGIPIRKENDETFAYFHQCYLRQAFNHLKPKKHRTKKKK